MMVLLAPMVTFSALAQSNRSSTLLQLLSTHPSSVILRFQWLPRATAALGQAAESFVKAAEVLPSVQIKALVQTGSIEQVNRLDGPARSRMFAGGSDQAV